MTRRRHSDTDPALSKAQLRHQRVFIDVLAHLDAAITRLANHLRKEPDRELKACLVGLKSWRRAVREQRKAAGL